MGNITSSSSFTDYRWLKPIQDPHGRDYYTPLPLNRMLTIESKYKKYQHLNHGRNQENLFAHMPEGHLHSKKSVSYLNSNSFS